MEVEQCFHDRCAIGVARSDDFDVMGTVKRLPSCSVAVLVVDENGNAGTFGNSHWKAALCEKKETPPSTFQ
jgi:hypothetical protein